MALKATLHVKGAKVDIQYDSCNSAIYPGGFWKKDKILIHDVYYQLTDSDVSQIVQYLYNEGFIQDRQTACEVVQY